MKRTVERKMVSHWSLLLALSMASGACRQVPCEDDFEEGERFQITVLGQNSAYSSCRPEIPTPSLSSGDVFTLVAGPAVMARWYGEHLESGVCNTRGARADAPPFLAGTLASCATAEERLGLTCTGTDASGCSLSVTARVGPIPPEAAVIDSGDYRLTWSSSCWAGSCEQLYDVRIDRLDVRPGG